MTLICLSKYMYKNRLVKSGCLTWTPPLPPVGLLPVSGAVGAAGHLGLPSAPGTLLLAVQALLPMSTLQRHCLALLDPGYSCHSNLPQASPGSPHAVCWHFKQEWEVELCGMLVRREDSQDMSPDA